MYVAERILVLTNKPTKIKAEVKVDLPRQGFCGSGS